MAHLESDRGTGAEGPVPAHLNASSPETRSLGWMSAGIALLLLLLWESGVRVNIISPLYFPSPSLIARTTFSLLREGPLLSHFAATMLRLVLALLLGGTPGLMLGLVMGWSPRLRALLDPYVAALHPIPKIAVLPLVMVIFGVGETSMVIVAAMGAFFPLLINTMSGVWQINPIHFDVARNYGAGRAKIFLRVVWPGSLPLVLAGLRLALNTTLLLTIAAEMFSPQQGLGAMIWLGWQTLRTEEIYVSLVVVTLLGLLFSFLTDGLSRLWVPWQTSHSS